MLCVLQSCPSIIHPNPEADPWKQNLGGMPNLSSSLEGELEKICKWIWAESPYLGHSKPCGTQVEKYVLYLTVKAT